MKSSTIAAVLNSISLLIGGARPPLAPALSLTNEFGIMVIVKVNLQCNAGKRLKTSVIGYMSMEQKYKHFLQSVKPTALLQSNRLKESDAFIRRNKKRSYNNSE